MINHSLLVSSLQVFGDLACCYLSMLCAYTNDKKYKSFFILNTIGFVGISLGDIYYNYFFRLLKHNIVGSLNFIVTTLLLTFQLTQICNWLSINRKYRIRIMELDNFPYLLFSSILIIVVTYYFVKGNIAENHICYQLIHVTLNMLVWTLAIICLSRSRTIGFTLLALGCLLISSAALTTDCLFMFAMNKLESAVSVHVIWTSGVWVMACGFYYCLRKEFVFCPNSSIQAKCCSWISITSLLVVLVIFSLLQFFDHEISYNLGSLLWGMPILLVLSMILSVLSGNWFSNLILFPVNNFINAIQDFDMGKPLENPQRSREHAYQLYEFNALNTFIKNAFFNMTNQLQREIKLSAHIAHDIRSPLLALESIIRRLEIEDEEKKILLRDTINHIRDITNNLEKDNISNQKQKVVVTTQIANLLEYVISERKAAYSNQKIEIKSDFDIPCYSLFVEVIPSEMKRILTNIINNAFEAIMAIEKPLVEVALSMSQSQIIITVSDNGSGIISEIMPKIFGRGFTTKNNGSGLGLYHAKENLVKWGGDIELNSNPSHGCSAKMMLPSKPMPLWFVSRLSFSKNSVVVCVEDSISIWKAWQDRFSTIQANIQLRYCSSREELINFLNNRESFMYTFLIDYEFSGKTYTGLKLAEIIAKYKIPNQRIFLVTSHSNEEGIQRICIEKEIYLIPKSYALKMPIHIFNPIQIKKIILMDLPIPNGLTENSYTSIIFYFDQNNLLADLSLFDVNTHVYIKNNLLNDLLIEKLKKHRFQFEIFWDLNTLQVTGEIS